MERKAFSPDPDENKVGSALKSADPHDPFKSAGGNRSQNRAQLTGSKSHTHSKPPTDSNPPTDSDLFISDGLQALTAFRFEETARRCEPPTRVRTRLRVQGTGSLRHLSTQSRRNFQTRIGESFRRNLQTPRTALAQGDAQPIRHPLRESHPKHLPASERGSSRARER